MSKLNFLVFLNDYSDSNASNNPSLSNFKWTRSMDGIPSDAPISQAFDLAPGESKTLFNGSRTLGQDGTTQYSIALKPLSSNTYVLTATSGTLPNFRAPRSTGADATTAVTVTINGPIATFSSTAGTPFNFAAVQVGDSARFGNLFNVLNQGEFQVISKTATSITVENENAAAEGPIVLGAGFAAQVQVYSALGVQKDDTLVISGGFSVVTQGSYKITDVAANYLEFYSTDILPAESNVQTQAIAVYSSAKNLIYVESDQKASLTINGSDTTKMEPFVINNSVSPGILMLKATIYSLSIQNTSLNSAKLLLLCVE